MLTYEKYSSVEEILGKQKKLQKINIIKESLLFYPYFLIHYNCKYEFCRWFASERQAIVLIDGLTGEGTEAKISKKQIDIKLPEGKHFVLKQSIIAANDEIALFLKINKGEELYQIDRLRFFGDVPAAIETAFLQKNRFPDLEQEDLTRTLQQILRERYGAQLSFLRSYLEPIIADEKTANLLQIHKGDPCMLFWRITYSSSSNPLFCSKNIIKGDFCKLQINSQ